MEKPLEDTMLNYGHNIGRWFRLWKGLVRRVKPGYVISKDNSYYLLIDFLAFKRELHKRGHKEWFNRNRS